MLPDRVELLVERLAETLVQLTPPQEPESFQILTLRAGAPWRGKSVKVGNIGLNVRGFLATVASGALSALSVATHPWTLPLACLVLLDRLANTISVELTEIDAGIAWAMWLNRDDAGYVADDRLERIVNDEMMDKSRPELSSKEIRDRVERLRGLGCIRQLEVQPLRWAFVESVNISFT